MHGGPDPGGGERVDVPDAVGVCAEQAHPPLVDARFGGLLDFGSVGPREGGCIDLQPDPLISKVPEAVKFSVPVGVAFDVRQLPLLCGRGRLGRPA